MFQNAISLANEAMNRSTNEREIALYISEAFDIKYPPKLWNCVVGEKFDTAVRIKDSSFIKFYLGNLKIVLFKSPA